MTGAVTAVPGKLGQAGSFDGQSWLTVNEREIFNLPNVTLALWAKPEAVDKRFALLGKRFAGTSTPYVLTPLGRRVIFRGD